MISKIYHRGMWQLPYKASGVLFPDGKRRTVKLHHTADSFWTIPAWVSYRNTTVSGFVTGSESEGLVFHPTGKNRNLFNEGK